MTSILGVVKLTASKVLSRIYRDGCFCSSYLSTFVVDSHDSAYHWLYFMNFQKNPLCLIQGTRSMRHAERHKHRKT